MTSNSGKYRIATILLFISSALHLLVAALAFADFGMPMIVAAALWTLLGLGVMRRLRWCAYLAFLGVIFGVSVALSGALASYGLVAILFWLIVVTDTLAAIALFGLLWSQRLSKRAVALGILP